MSAAGMNRDDLLSRPGLNSRVQDGTMQIRARKMDQRDLDLPLEIILDAANARYNIREVARAAVCAGWTVKAVARGFGRTAQTISNWVAAGEGADPLFDYPSPTITVPRMVKRADRVPTERLDELKRLNSIIKTINGGTPVDDPRRASIPVYGELLVRTMVEFHLGAQPLSRAIGLSGRNVALWLGRHGYVHLPPSQSAYRGTTSHAERARNSGRVS